MDEQKQDDKVEPIYNCYKTIQDIALNTSREQWKIETSGDRGSGRSMLTAWHDDDDDEKGGGRVPGRSVKVAWNDIYIYIYIYTYLTFLDSLSLSAE